jgi:hypothetical protein
MTLPRFCVQTWIDEKGSKTQRIVSGHVRARASEQSDRAEKLLILVFSHKSQTANSKTIRLCAGKERDEKEIQFCQVHA